MKKHIMSLVLLGLTTVSTANAASSPANLVERPLTLAEGETSLAIGAIYGDKQDGSNDWDGDLALGYGITENLTLDFSGLRYRFLQRPNNATGLELNLGVGVRGELESDQFGDAQGYGIDVAGKYVFSSEVAAIFSVGYIRWDEDRRDDKHEVDYTFGIQKQVIEGLTLSAAYTYRDLSDFAQNNAYAWSMGATYNIKKDLDVSLLYGRTDFDYASNGYDANEHYRNGLGLYVTYRF